MLPKLTPGEALRRRWPLAIAPVAILGVLALLAGISRPPIYTAESRLVVEGISSGQVGSPQGLVQASESLASTYSRAVTATAVIDPVGRELGVSPGEVAVRLDAAPIPESPVFEVRGDGASSEEAIQLANTATASLIDYVDELNEPDPSPAELLKDYQRATIKAEQLAARTRELRGARGARGEAAFGRADAAQDAAQLRRDSLRARFRNAQENSTSASVAVLNPAAAAISDRWSRIQFFVFAGLAAGAVLGLGLAVLATNRLIRRQVGA